MKAFTSAELFRMAVALRLTGEFTGHVALADRIEQEIERRRVVGQLVAGMHQAPEVATHGS